ncbi:MAG: hypothetical protein JWL83_2926 [Actinomycetia bacterium]|nr:hypothetical protein [Actinomycetes bacterium]
MRSLGSALLVALLFALFGALTACSGSGNKAASHPNARVACVLLRSLDKDGQLVAGADVKDPAAFNGAMSTAVKRYAATLDELRPVVPRNLQPNVDRLHAAVEQYRFGDGIDDHAALSTYRTRACR